VSVTITDSTPGATIYYTTDGSTPTTASTQYTGPISVTSTQTIKAIATAPGYAPSAVATATYTIQLPAATPVLSPAGGTYTSSVSVTIRDSTPGETIYYTTDGSTQTIKAIATAPGYTPSAVASATYTIQVPAATPVLSPSGGTYSSSVSVTITDGTPSATIYYTTDGSTPTTASTQYTGAISVASTQTVKAIATAPGYTPSAVASAAYTVQVPAATPVLSPAGGTYTSSVSVTITDSTPGAPIYYTTDGRTPTRASPQDP